MITIATIYVYFLYVEHLQSVTYPLAHLNFTTILGGIYCYESCCTEEKIKTVTQQRRARARISTRHCQKKCSCIKYFNTFLFFYFSILAQASAYWFQRERKGGRRRETSISFLSQEFRTGVELAIQGCALTRNRTLKLLVHRMMLQPTETPGQGKLNTFLQNQWTHLLFKFFSLRDFFCFITNKNKDTKALERIFEFME